MCAEFGDPSLSMSFIRNHDEGCRQLILLDNIAFEFGQSWMAEASMFYFDMKGAQSARGYWASLIRGVSEGRVTPSESLWIIDRNAKWFEESLKDNKTVYRDCEGEYVEVGWDNIPKSTGDGVSLSVSAFLSSFISSSHVELRQIFAGPGSLYPDCAYESDEEAFDFKLEDRFRLLVRRGNQVQEVT
ncbi:tetracycline resistance [Fusarium sporotrichioides]|uniref:Tetracycline resistance n=1 Tax=Fusarium sporotrichioides TaxID=5514 RepID=A0A395S144_FUSSP|nr:tetracycline resistance [Fusarium sporotrichioides]